MRIYFLTREPDVCQLLADSFTKPDNEIKIFPIITKLFQTVFDEGILPDILFLDFLYFQSDAYDFYSILKKKNKIFPVVHCIKKKIFLVLQPPKNRILQRPFKN